MTSRALLTAGLGLACAGLLTACATTVETDPVIAGRKYMDEAIPLGPVKMRIRAEGPVIKSAISSWMPFGDDEAADPERVSVSLGFLSSREVTSVVVRSGSLKSARTGQVAELQERFQAEGSNDECLHAAGPVENDLSRGAQAHESLNLDYWFNHRVNPDAWTCVTLAFRLPGLQPGDLLELTLNPVNVAGNIIRVLPIAFEPR